MSEDGCGNHEKRFPLSKAADEQRQAAWIRDECDRLRILYASFRRVERQAEWSPKTEVMKLKVQWQTLHPQARSGVGHGGGGGGGGGHSSGGGNGDISDGPGLDLLSPRLRSQLRRLLENTDSQSTEPATSPAAAQDNVLSQPDPSSLPMETATGLTQLQQFAARVGTKDYMHDLLDPATQEARKKRREKAAAASALGKIRTIAKLEVGSDSEEHIGPMGLTAAMCRMLKSPKLKMIDRRLEKIKKHLLAVSPTK